jgi:hypothetical protein
MTRYTERNYTFDLGYRRVDKCNYSLRYTDLKNYLIERVSTFVKQRALGSTSEGDAYAPIATTSATRMGA